MPQPTGGRSLRPHGYRVRCERSSMLALAVICSPMIQTTCFDHPRRRCPRCLVRAGKGKHLGAGQQPLQLSLREQLMTQPATLGPQRSTLPVRAVVSAGDPRQVPTDKEGRCPSCRQTSLS